MRIPVFFAVATLTAALAGACTTADEAPMDTGERISQRGGQISGYGKVWSEGQNDVRKGELLIERSRQSQVDGERKLAKARKRIAKAESQINDARASQLDGARLVTSGKTQMQQGEADYRVIRTQPSAIEGQ